MTPEIELSYYQLSIVAVSGLIHVTLEGSTAISVHGID